MESKIKIDDPAAAVEAQSVKAENLEIMKRRTFARIGAVALATAFLGSPFAAPKSNVKSIPISTEFQDNKSNSPVIEFADPESAPDIIGASESATDGAGATDTIGENTPFEPENTIYIAPVIPTAENGGTQYVVPVGSAPTTDPHQETISKPTTKSVDTAVPKATPEQNSTAHNSSSSMPTDLNLSQPVEVLADTPSVAPIAEGADIAMKTAFAEGAYVSEEAARKIADVIINRAMSKGTSVGAEVTAKGQFEAYINGTKGHGNWGWNQYGSGPQKGSIGTERVQQIFTEELNKAMSGQPLAYGYTRFGASGDGRTNVYH